MNNLTRKLIAIEFSYQFLYKGLTKDVFITMMNLLPNDAKVISFGSHMDRASQFFVIESDSFLPVEEAAIIPHATLYFEDNKPARIEYPDNYKNNHTCTFKSYNGFLKTEKVCSICGKTES